MRDVRKEQLNRVGQIWDEIRDLVEEMRNIYDRSFHGPESEKVCNDRLAEAMSKINLVSGLELRATQKVLRKAIEAADDMDNPDEESPCFNCPVRDALGSRVGKDPNPQ